ncbi:MAG: SAM-dependent methyltransferase [Betaproteobacteria bacterium]|nr:SAM-dependent methyltransferase [Betaproteobacteria bacterium]
MTHSLTEPSAWVRRHAALIRPSARVLDLAAGRGRHATLTGVAGVRTLAADLEAGAWPLAGERFDAIVVANYLHRPSFDAMLGTLADDGVLVYETFAAGNEALGRPTNPDFLLAAGELLEQVRGRLAVVAFEEGHRDARRRPGGRAAPRGRGAAARAAVAPPLRVGPAGLAG